MRKLGHAVTALAISPLLVLACQIETNPPPATPPAAPVTTVVAPVPPTPPVPVAVQDAGTTAVAVAVDAAAATAPAPVTLAPGDFYSCAQDSDCVAVPKVGCCHNGHLAAVNKQATDAYAKSFTCGNPRPMCPQYIVKDTKVAKCDSAAHKCEMVAPPAP